MNVDIMQVYLGTLLLFFQDVPKPRIPILHYNGAKPPLLLCIKWVRPFIGNKFTYFDISVLFFQDLTDGGFERNLESLHLREGQDYYHFS